jgi:hypothetical protein
VEPPVRIELTTYALQERCSTTELRRRVVTLQRVSRPAHPFRARDRFGFPATAFAYASTAGRSESSWLWA